MESCYFGDCYFFLDLKICLSFPICERYSGYNVFIFHCTGLLNAISSPNFLQSPQEKKNLHWGWICESQWMESSCFELWRFSSWYLVTCYSRENTLLFERFLSFNIPWTQYIDANSALSILIIILRAVLSLVVHVCCLQSGRVCKCSHEFAMRGLPSEIPPFEEPSSPGWRCAITVSGSLRWVRGTQLEAANWLHLNPIDICRAVCVRLNLCFRLFSAIFCISTVVVGNHFKLQWKDRTNVKVFPAVFLSGVSSYLLRMFSRHRPSS